jgi:hypothetical protein
VPIQLVAQVKDKSGKTVNGVALTWASSDPTVASVSNGGMLTPLRRRRRDGDRERERRGRIDAGDGARPGSSHRLARATSAPTWPASPTGRPNFPFADLMKSGMGWRSLEAGDVWDAPFPALTADGYPAALKPGQRAVSAVAWYDSHYPAGRYVVLWDGAGSIGFPMSKVTVAEASANRIAIDVTDTSGPALGLDRQHQRGPIRFATCASSGPAPNPPTRCSRSTRSS